MSSATPIYEVGAVALGYVGTVASWRRPSAAHPRANGPMLIIQSCDSTDEGVYQPAACITLTTREAMLALKAAIDEALKPAVPA